VTLQARLGIPTGRADIGLEPTDDSAAFLRTLRKDFEKVRCLLELVVHREKLKREKVHLLFVSCLLLSCLDVKVRLWAELPKSPLS